MVFLSSQKVWLHDLHVAGLNGTWSTKYNLLWQRLLGLDGFPDDVFEIETAFYMQQLHTFGVPLDSRATFAKADWMMWMAAFQPPENFAPLTDALYSFLNETVQRVPFADW